MDKKWIATLMFAVLLSLPVPAKASDKDTEEARVTASGDVLKELLNGPEGIPVNLLNKAECVIVLPSVKKAGFLIAGSYGRGDELPAGSEFR